MAARSPKASCAAVQAAHAPICAACARPPLPPRTPRWQVPCLDPRPPACPALPTCSVSLHSYVRPPSSGPSCYRPVRPPGPHGKFASGCLLRLSPARSSGQNAVLNPPPSCHPRSPLLRGRTSLADLDSARGTTLARYIRRSPRGPRAHRARCSGLISTPGSRPATLPYIIPISLFAQSS